MERPTRGDIERADVIIGVDMANDNKTLFYGRSMLKLIAEGYEGPQGVSLTVLRVPVDFNTDDPEWLAAACEAFKGGCDIPEDGWDEPPNA
jgi:hypothetical protein